MSTRHLAAKLPKKSTFKSLLVLGVLAWIVVKWPQQSAAFVQHIASSLHVFITALGGGA